MVRMEVATGNTNKYCANLHVIVPASPANHRCLTYKNTIDIGMSITLMRRLEHARLAMSKCVDTLIPHLRQTMNIPREFPTKAKRNETEYKHDINITVNSSLAFFGAAEKENNGKNVSSYFSSLTRSV